MVLTKFQVKSMSRKITGVNHPGLETEYKSKDTNKGKMLLFRKEAGDFSFYLYEDRIWHCDLEEHNPNGLSIGTVVLGRVEKVLSEMHACFVKLQPTVSGFLSIPKSHPLPHQNDYLLVQVIKDAQKNKECEVTQKIEIPGEFFVLKSGHGTLQVSKKATEEQVKKATDLMQEEKAALCTNNSIPYQDFLSHVDILCRTDALSLPEKDFQNELRASIDNAYQILVLGKSKSLYGISYKPEPAYVQFIKRHLAYGVTEVVTDSQDLFEEASQYLKDIPVRYYEDTALDLASVYRIPSLLKNISEKKVLLPSGGSIVIEQTEALVAIDVNSGKKQSKLKEEYLLSANIEACKEIFYQIQARNLSGMILIDFINLQSKESIESLLAEVKECCKKDTVFCRFVDYTGLGLVEVTRQKLSMPLHEKRMLDKFEY